MATSRRSRQAQSKRKTPRDLDHLDALRDGRLNRAATYADRRKKRSKEACRTQSSYDD